MEIERINENTVKFYISYIDIEDRGFEREEIWYNRERSEQLFWQIMEEVNYKEDFPVEGPLWIQVQAMEKGLEIIVTKAQISKNGESVDPLKEIEESIDITLNEKLPHFSSSEKAKNKAEESLETDEEDAEQEDLGLWMTASFENFEDLIQLSHYFKTVDLSGLHTKVYHYQDKYYIYVELEHDIDARHEDLLSQILEFSKESSVTAHLLEEYGKPIFEEEVFYQVRQLFDA